MPFVPTTLPDSLPASAPTPKEEWQLLKTLPLDDLINQLVSRIVHFAIQVAVAVAVFYIGKFLIRKLHNLMARILLRRRVDPSLSTFLLSMVRIVLYFILIVTVVGILGIETSSFIALFASAGVAVGMALSGTLQNFAGGVLILLLKPYRVGNYIEAQGYAGTVREIQIFHTIISTYDNKSIIIPNGGLSTGTINNWSREDYRRVEWAVSVSYGNSFDEVRQALMQIIASDEDIVKKYVEDHREERRKAGKTIQQNSDDSDEDCNPETDPECEERRRGFFSRLFHKNPVIKAAKARANAPLPVMPIDRSPAVVLDNLGSSSVDLKVRAWVPTELYWNVYYRINQRIYTELPRPGISFPFPQLDVHIQDPNSK